MSYFSFVSVICDNSAVNKTFLFKVNVMNHTKANEVNLRK